MLKDSILKALDVRASNKVQIGEFDGKPVFVRAMSGFDRDEYQKLWVNSDGKLPHAFKAHAIVRSVCDSEGHLVFELKDVEDVNKLDGLTLDKWFQKVDDVNLLSNRKAEEVEKN